MLYSFKTNEIETIIKVMIDNKKEEMQYGYVSEEYSFPKPIENKLQNLNENEYEDFISTCEEICEEVMDTLNGELNMLHMFHNQIRIIVEEYTKNNKELL